MKDFIRDISQFDKVIGYYSTKHDIPFLRTRCADVANRLGIPNEFPKFQAVKHYDLYYTVKYKLKLTRNSLEAVCRFYGIKAKTHYTTVAVMKGSFKSFSNFKITFERFLFPPKMGSVI